MSKGPEPTTVISSEQGWGLIWEELKRVEITPGGGGPFEGTAATGGDFHPLQLFPNQPPALFGGNYRCRFGSFGHTFYPSTASCEIPDGMTAGSATRTKTFSSSSLSSLSNL